MGSKTTPSRKEFKRRLLSRLSILAENDIDTDGFAELVDECQLEWTTAVGIASEIAAQLQRRSDRLK